MDMVADLRAAKVAREAKAAAIAKLVADVKALVGEPDPAVEADPIRNLEQYADRELEGERGLFQASW